MKLVNQILDTNWTDPDDRRRARLLNILLLGLASLLLLTLLVSITSKSDSQLEYLLLLSASFMFISIGIVYIINRYWSSRLAGWITLGLLSFAIAFGDSPEQVVRGRTLFMLIIPILMASVVLPPYSSFIMAGLVSLLLSIITWIAQLNPTPVVLIGFFAVALVSWLAARSLEQALRDLRYELAERKRAEKALQQSEERYALAAHGANDGLWDWDLETDKIYLSPRWKAMLGYEEDDVDNTLDEWFNRVHPDDREVLKNAIDAHIHQKTFHFVHEYRLLYRDGTYRWMLCRGVAVRNADGQAYRMAGSQTDITRRKAAEDQLLHDALHDTLTKLPNRTLFLDHLAWVIGHTGRQPGHLVAVLFLDLDRFKIINNSLGHATGDQFLIALSQRLESSIRAGDMIARLAGDKFAILLDGLKDTTEAEHLAKKIQNQVAKPINLYGQEVSTTVSIGLVLGQNALPGYRYKFAKEMLRDADTALNQAKAQGPATIAWFNPNMHTQAVARMQLEIELRQALERNQFRLYYQPIISTSGGKITGAEVLLRWQHPEYGVIHPDEFVSTLEETGLIIPVGEWILCTGCAQIKRWRKAGYNFRIAVNLSVRQLQEQNLPQRIKMILTEVGLPPNALELEITETIAMQNVMMSLALLNKLKSLGLNISIDDFGTGYSSLTRLKQLPINTLKIDKSFIKDVTFHENDAAITRAIIAMGRHLNLKLIVEGVETTQQLAFLQSLQCDEMQGYLFSRPLPVDEFTQLLSKYGNNSWLPVLNQNNKPQLEALDVGQIG